MFDVFKYRRPAIVLFELGLLGLANYLAFSLRFGGAIPPDFFSLWLLTLPLVVGVRSLMFIPFRLYQGLWRYTSLWDLGNIAAAVVLSSALIAVIVNPMAALAYPRSIILIDTLLLICLMTGVRLLRRVYRGLRSGQRAEGVLIYGAGDAGEMIVRDMRNNPYYKIAPIGFIDDDPKKAGSRIHGVPVLGNRHSLKSILQRHSIHEILIAMPRATPSELRAILKMLEPFKIPIKTLPNLSDLLDGKVTISQIRSLAFEDLLQRTPVGLDAVPVRRHIKGKCVMVTGAGGSIGSELCRQILEMEPTQLVLFERYENSLYSIENDLNGRNRPTPIVPVIGDITDKFRVRGVLETYEPQIVFHAAAHKHVPLMELNSCESIKNNITGTRILAQESESHGVEQFILISSDKAVNPSSVMGCTKRIAEIIMQSMDGMTDFTCVRFGNVLGSNGSVIPRFLEQIRAGGPVTVTHPEMRRYFMLISEAVQLVLHAAAIGTRGSIYVLEMGDEFKVVDLARNLIRLSGFVPDEEIGIEYIGLRPGEKLSEELVGENETIERSPAQRIFKVRPAALPDRSLLAKRIAELEDAAKGGRSADIIPLLQAIVPTYRPIFDTNHVASFQASSSRR